MRLIIATVGALLAATGCTNPDGAITITNQYTGVCTMRWALGEEVQESDFTPLSAGDSDTSAEAGIVQVRLRTSATICGGAQTCQFADSGLEGKASCRVYAAGEQISAHITIVDGIYRCPSTGQDELIPVVDCGPGGVKF